MADASASGVVGACSFPKSTFAHCFLPRQTPTTRPRNGVLQAESVAGCSAKFFRHAAMPVTCVRQCQWYITHRTHERSRRPFGPCMHSQCYGAITRSAVPGAREPVGGTCRAQQELAELNNKRTRREFPVVATLAKKAQRVQK